MSIDHFDPRGHLARRYTRFRQVYSTQVKIHGPRWPSRRLWREKVPLDPTSILFDLPFDEHTKGLDEPSTSVRTYLPFAVRPEQWPIGRRSGI